MAEDREILREVWEGKIPICFQLSTDELNSYDHPEDYYILFPRHGYFPLYMDKIQKHFSKYVNNVNDEDLWLEDKNGQPIRWQYPIGVLYDSNFYGSNLPWVLTVNYRKFPDDIVPRLLRKELIESHFMSCVKEADYIKFGKNRIMKDMQKQHHKQLWTGLLTDKFEQFWAINKKLMETHEEKTFMSIPFKIHQGDLPFIQIVVKPENDENCPKTLKDLLLESIPEIFDETMTPLNCQIIIHGIQIPLESELLWLSKHFSYPDNFLHISINNPV